jgi:CRP/FNR family transcriptional regulator/voltage-gated potassium channel
LSVEETLAHVELFSELEKDDLERLAKVTVSREFETGDVIVREGELGVAFYIVAKGKVEVVKDLGAPNEQVLATMSEGDFFGEMSLFDNEVRSASVRAAAETECLVLTKWDFNAELTTSPTITHAMFRILARRIREANADAPTH